MRISDWSSDVCSSDLDVFEDFAAPKGAEDRQLWLQQGEPMLYAKGAKGIALDHDALELKVVDVVDGDWQAAGVIVHDVTNRSVAHLLVEMRFGAFLMALGVLSDRPPPTFEARSVGPNEAGRRRQPPPTHP